MESKSNVSQHSAVIGQHTREELEQLLGDLGDQEKQTVEAVARNRKIRRSDVVRDLLKLSDPDQTNPAELSQQFLKQRMNNQRETLPRFSFGD